jgi:DNA-binding transcriptional ArsR family regulator
METSTASTIFEALSSTVRLDVYRLLVRYGSEGRVAGEIATALDLPASNLSFHLKALTHVQLLRVQQEGRFLRYRANLPLMLELLAFLSAECCVAQSTTCAPPQLAQLCPSAAAGLSDPCAIDSSGSDP